MPRPTRASFQGRGLANTHARKENIVLRLGIGCWMGTNWQHQASLHGSLGENQDPLGKQEEYMPHEVEGHVRKRHCPAALKRWYHWQRQGRWEFGTFGRWEFQHRLLLEPAAARTSCSMVQNIKCIFATGHRGADGERAVALATTSILHKAFKKKTTQTSSIALSAPLRHTQDLHAQETARPKKHGKCSTLGMDERGWLHG
jgi:hypothetical protein